MVNLEACGRKGIQHNISGEVGRLLCIRSSSACRSGNITSQCSWELGQRGIRGWAVPPAGQATWKSRMAYLAWRNCWWARLITSTMLFHSDVTSPGLSLRWCHTSPRLYERRWQAELTMRGHYRSTTRNLPRLSGRTARLASGILMSHLCLNQHLNVVSWFTVL